MFLLAVSVMRDHLYIGFASLGSSMSLTMHNMKVVRKFAERENLVELQTEKQITITHLGIKRGGRAHIRGRQEKATLCLERNAV